MLLFSLLLGCFEADQNQGAEITFYRDVEPIVQQHCVRCHQADGQGPGDFTDPKTVQVMAEAILSSIESKEMPPPAADPECRDYVDSESFHFPMEKAEVISKWLDEGTPLGDVSDAQQYENINELENPDLFVQISEPFSPNFDSEANPGNQYRCFALEHGRTEPFYITAMHPIIDEPSIVHHVVVARANRNGIIEGADRPQGTNCIRNGIFIDNFEDIVSF